MDRFQGQKELQQYRKLIQYKFSQIYFSRNDSNLSNSNNANLSSSVKSLINIKSFYITEEHREEIFYSEYSMQKRGKKFGSSELRIFKAVRETAQLLQVDKNRQAKKLPLPTGFKVQNRESIQNSAEIEWNSKLQSSKWRIKLLFAQRSEIFVYFDNEQNCHEIACFISFLIQKHQGEKQSFVFGKCSGNFGYRLGSEFGDKIIRYRNEVEKRKQIKRQQKAVKFIENNFNDSILIKAFVEKWRGKTFNRVEIQTKREKSECKRKAYKINDLKITEVVSSIRFESKNIFIKINQKNDDELLYESTLIEGLKVKSNQSMDELKVENHFMYYPKQKQLNQSSQLSIDSMQLIKVQVIVERGDTLDANKVTSVDIDQVTSIDRIQIKEKSNQINEDNRIGDKTINYEKFQSYFTIFQIQYLSTINCSNHQIWFNSQKHSTNSFKKRKIQLNLQLFKEDNQSNHENAVNVPQELLPLESKQQIETSIDEKLIEEHKIKENITQNHSPSLIVLLEINYSEIKANKEFQIMEKPEFTSNQHSKSVGQSQKNQREIIRQIQSSSQEQKLNITEYCYPHQFTHHHIPFIQNIILAQQLNTQQKQQEKYQNLLNCPQQSGNSQTLRFSLDDYRNKYDSHLSQNLIQQISFNCVQKLLQSLKVDSLIEKFLFSQTFTYIKTQTYKGTLIYQYLIDKSSHLKYYDVQKLILQFSDSQIRRLLNAIKTFDQTPRINFTEPIYQICHRILTLVKNQVNSSLHISNQLNQKNPLQSAKQSFFDLNSSIGMQSCAFFIILGLIKEFSPIFIYQKEVQRRALHYNSLLVRLIVKKEFPEVHKKCLSLQLNIQALFGIEFCSLLSSYFSDWVFVKLITESISIRQREKDSKIFPFLISSFIALLELTLSQHNQEILTGESLLIYLKEYSKALSSSKQSFERFLDLQNKVTHLIKFYNEEQFQCMMRELNEIYEGSRISSQKLSFGTLIHAVYEEFRHYKPKQVSQLSQSKSDSHNSNSLLDNNYLSQQSHNKIFLSIDRLNLSDEITIRKMLIQMYQGKHQLYSHQFKNIDLQTFTLSVELIPQSSQNITFFIKTKYKSYYYSLPYEQLPSNYYHHLTQPLHNSLKQHNSLNKYTSIPSDNSSYISLQIFIKDLTPVEHFQNILPQKYCNLILYDPQIKDCILQVGKYLRNFRMTENNFNLLYAKLGWYGNHYLLPHDRILSLFKGLDPAGINEQAGTHKVNSPKEQDQLYALLHYTRTVFGKGIPIKPKSISVKDICILDTIKNNIRSITHYSQIYQNNSIPSSPSNEHKSTQNLLSYTLDNFDMNSTESFFQFYQKVIHLPLINYLTYDPLIFYILPPIQFVCSYLNQLEGVKLNLVINLCDSSEERKEGEPWEKLVTEFDMRELDLLEKLMSQIEDFYFNTHDDQSESQSFKLIEHSSSRVNRFGMPSLNPRVKQFYTLFPKTLNFSHIYFNAPIDTIGLILKFNIVSAIVRILSKAPKKEAISQKETINLKETIGLEERKNPTKIKQSIEQASSTTQRYHYRLKMLQDDYQIPNTQYYHLFRYMIEAPKETHVYIQLKKQRYNTNPEKHHSQNLYLPVTHSTNTASNDILHQQFMDKLKKNSTSNQVKKYHHLGLIHGRWSNIEVLYRDSNISTHQNHQNHEQSSDNLTISKTTIFSQRENQETIQLQLNDLKNSESFVVEEKENRKLYRLKNQSIIWKSSNIHQHQSKNH